jgi:membrane-associated phospholipid phosphatase
VSYCLYGALFTLLLGLLVNLFYKISLHTLAWGAAAASLSGLSIKMMLGIPGIVAGTVLIAGLAAWARLKLNAHNPSQVYLGFIAGVTLIMILTFVL